MADIKRPATTISLVRLAGAYMDSTSFMATLMVRYLRVPRKLLSQTLAKR